MLTGSRSRVRQTEGEKLITDMENLDTPEEIYLLKVGKKGKEKKQKLME